MEGKTEIKDGKLFLYFEKKSQYVEAEIKQDRINILPAVPRLADFSVVPPAKSILSQAEELSSDFPKIEKMTARTGLYWNGIPYEYEMTKYSLNSNLDINWLNHFFDKTSSDINQFNAILSPQEAQERLNELLKTAESMDYTGDAVSHKSNIGKNRLRTFQFFAEQLRNGNIGYYDRGAVISTGQANWTTVNKSEIIDEPEYMFEKGWLLIVNDLDIEKAPEEVVTLYMRVSKSSSAYKNNLTKKSDIVNNTGIMYMKENNNTYGFVHNNKIYLNPDIMNSNAAVHDIKNDDNLVLSEIYI